MRTAHSINITPGIGIERTRTFSSDSGCDVHLDPLDHHASSLEITVKVWQARLAVVVKQEVNRAEEVTHWATGGCSKGYKKWIQERRNISKGVF